MSVQKQIKQILQEVGLTSFQVYTDATSKSGEKYRIKVVCKKHPVALEHKRVLHKLAAIQGVIGVGYADAVRGSYQGGYYVHTTGKPSLYNQFKNS
jgi:hypothetical protein